MHFQGTVQVISKKSGTNRAGDPTYGATLGYMGGNVYVSLDREQYESIEKEGYYNVSGRIGNGYEGKMTLFVDSIEARKR